jgi:hypothetical protein
VNLLNNLRVQNLFFLFPKGAEGGEETPGSSTTKKTPKSRSTQQPNQVGAEIDGEDGSTPKQMKPRFWRRQGLRVEENLEQVAASPEIVSKTVKEANQKALAAYRHTSLLKVHMNYAFNS